MRTSVRTTCRVCESACGLVAEVDADRVVGLSPDKEHPVSKGYACKKGLGFLRIHDHPERLVRPKIRRDGQLVDVTWDEALGFAGERIRAIRAAHGPHSVGLYLGNATVQSWNATLGATALQQALGTWRQYSALTLDNSEMFVVAEACFGNPLIGFVADYAGSDCIVLIGTDPLSSQPSQGQSNPEGVRELIRAGAALTVIDPRTSATARKASLHLRPRMSSDVFLLGWLIRELLPQKRWEGDALLDPDDVRALERLVAPIDEDTAIRVTGLTAAELHAVRDRLLASKRPLVWSGLGVLLGPDGTIGWWLTLALQAVLGGIDRPGGWVHQPGAIDIPKLARWAGLHGTDPKVRSRRGHPAVLGSLASATLAEDIEAGDVRGLVCIAGNPAVSLPDTPRARKALESLELLVSVDLFVNDTATLAHVALPSTDWLEREDVAVHLAYTRRLPHLERNPAVVPPRGQVRDDFRIACDVARAAGLQPFGSRIAGLAIQAGLDATSIARLGVLFGGGVRWADVLRPGGSMRAMDPHPLRASGTGRADRRIRLVHAPFAEGLQKRLADPPVPRMRLLTSVRPVNTMNSWVRGDETAPVAALHPDELAALGIADGGRVRIARESGPEFVEIAVKADPGLARGVVVIPFGWGHVDGAVHGGLGGVSANVLVGTETLEPFTGQPISNGLPVRVDVVNP